MAGMTLLIFLFLALVSWFAVSQEGDELRPVEQIARPAAFVLLLLFAATGRDPSLWLVAALGFSLLGDVYLMLKGRGLFTAGIAALTVAQLAYIVDFDAAPGWRVFWFIILGGVSCFLVARRIVGAIDNTGLRRLVALHLAVLVFMAGSAVASGSTTAALGALILVLADMLLVWNRFVQPFPSAPLLVMSSFHLAQLLLVIALRS